MIQLDLALKTITRENLDYEEQISVFMSSNIGVSDEEEIWFHMYCVNVLVSIMIDQDE